MQLEFLEYTKQHFPLINIQIENINNNIKVSKKGNIVKIIQFTTKSHWEIWKQNFLLEVEHQQQLSEQFPNHIVQIIDWSLENRSNQILIYVTYNCTQKAQSLHNFLLKALIKSEQKRDLCQQILEIAYILESSNIQHRNIKLTNFIIVDKKVQLTDFGSARTHYQTYTKQSNTSFERQKQCESIYYNCPEILEIVSQENVDFQEQEWKSLFQNEQYKKVILTRNDNWAISVVLLQLVNFKIEISDDIKEFYGYNIAQFDIEIKKIILNPELKAIGETIKRLSLGQLSAAECLQGFLNQKLQKQIKIKEKQQQQEIDGVEQIQLSKNINIKTAIDFLYLSKTQIEDLEQFYDVDQEKKIIKRIQPEKQQYQAVKQQNLDQLHDHKSQFSDSQSFLVFSPKGPESQLLSEAQLQLLVNENVQKISVQNEKNQTTLRKALQNEKPIKLNKLKDKSLAFQLQKQNLQIFDEKQNILQRLEESTQESAQKQKNELKINQNVQTISQLTRSNTQKQNSFLNSNTKINSQYDLLNYSQNQAQNLNEVSQQFNERQSPIQIKKSKVPQEQQLPFPAKIIDDDADQLVNFEKFADIAFHSRTIKEVFNIPFEKNQFEIEHGCQFQKQEETDKQGFKASRPEQQDQYFVKNLEKLQPFEKQQFEIQQGNQINKQEETEKLQLQASRPEEKQQYFVNEKLQPFEKQQFEKQQGNQINKQEDTDKQQLKASCSQEQQQYFVKNLEKLQPFQKQQFEKQQGNQILKQEEKDKQQLKASCPQEQLQCFVKNLEKLQPYEKQQFEQQQGNQINKQEETDKQLLKASRPEEKQQDFVKNLEKLQPFDKQQFQKQQENQINKQEETEKQLKASRPEEKQQYFVKNLEKLQPFDKQQFEKQQGNQINKQEETDKQQLKASRPEEKQQYFVKNLEKLPPFEKQQFEIQQGNQILKQEETDKQLFKASHLEQQAEDFVKNLDIVKKTDPEKIELASYGENILNETCDINQKQQIHDSQFIEYQERAKQQENQNLYRNDPIVPFENQNEMKRIDGDRKAMKADQKQVTQINDKNIIAQNDKELSKTHSVKKQHGETVQTLQQNQSLIFQGISNQKINNKFQEEIEIQTVEEDQQATNQKYGLMKNNLANKFDQITEENIINLSKESIRKLTKQEKQLYLEFLQAQVEQIEQNNGSLQTQNKLQEIINLLVHSEVNQSGTEIKASKETKKIGEKETTIFDQYCSKQFKLDQKIELNKEKLIENTITAELKLNKLIKQKKIDQILSVDELKLLGNNQQMEYLNLIDQLRQNNISENQMEQINDQLKIIEQNRILQQKLNSDVIKFSSLSDDELDVLNIPFLENYLQQLHNKLDQTNDNQGQIKQKIQNEINSVKQFYDQQLQQMDQKQNQNINKQNDIKNGENQGENMILTKQLVNFTNSAVFSRLNSINPSNEIPEKQQSFGLEQAPLLPTLEKPLQNQTPSTKSNNKKKQEHNNSPQKNQSEINVQQQLAELDDFEIWSTNPIIKRFQIWKKTQPAFYEIPIELQQYKELNRQKIENHKILYGGNSRDEKPHGLGILMKKPFGSIYEGIFNDGKFIYGLVLELNEKKQLQKFIGYYHKEKEVKNGIAQITWYKEKVQSKMFEVEEEYQGPIIFGQLTGFATRFNYIQGWKYEGYWKKSKKEGTGSLFIQNEKKEYALKYQGQFHDDLPHGQGKCFHDTQLYEQGEYVKGQKIGQHFLYMNEVLQKAILY